MSTRIKVCEPSVTSIEKDYVSLALAEKKISSTGGLVEEFEKSFAEKIGVQHAIAVNSGGSALFLTLWALGIRMGNEVIVPDFTMVATAGAVKQCYAKPIFVDCTYETGNIDTNLIEQKITKKTKAIIVVHLYGYPCDMDRIMEIANKNNIAVIEDAAEAHGAQWKGQSVGSIGRAGCFSFYANKIITTGEGGAITTNDYKLAVELRKLRSYYFPDMGHFEHEKLAWNLRMSSLEAALGLAQLTRWNQLIEKRIENAQYYEKNLLDLHDYIEFVQPCKDGKNVYWMFWIKVRDRDGLMKYLEDNGVETRKGFKGMHLQPFLKDKGSYPVSESLWANSMYLPSSSDITREDQDYIINLIKNFYDTRRGL